MKTFLGRIFNVLKSQLTSDAVIFPQTSAGDILTPKLSWSRNIRHQRYSRELCRSHVRVGRRYPNITAPTGVSPILDNSPTVVDRLGESGERGQGHGLPVDAGGATRGVEAGDQVGCGGL